MDGICVRCKEWTDAVNPCCGHGVYVDGDVWSQKEAFNKALTKAVEEAANVEPDESGTGSGSFHDLEGYRDIAKRYELNIEQFTNHLAWVFSDQKIGSEYENI